MQPFLLTLYEHATTGVTELPAALERQIILEIFG
jgi:hypothetical protein